jgi:hypothetical protein
MTIRLEGSKVKSGELPLKYLGGMKADCAAQNRDSGFYKGKQEDNEDPIGVSQTQHRVHGPLGGKSWRSCIGWAK